MKYILTLLLYIFFILLSMSIALFFSDISPTVLSSDQTIEGYERDDVYTFDFKSIEDNLGILYLPVQTSNTFYPLQTVFAIKDKHTGKTIYNGHYNIKFTSTNYIFPFGFPIINDSKNKDYKVEIYQINTQKSIFSMDKNIKIVSKYSFGKNNLQTDSQLLIHFITEKFIYEVTKAEFWLKTVFFLSPLLMIGVFALNTFQRLIFFPGYFSKNLRRHANPYIFSFILLIYFDIVFTNSISNLYIITICIFWIVLHYVLGLKIHALVIALILISITFVLQSLGFYQYALRSSVWIFICILLGLVQELIDSNSERLSTNSLQGEKVLAKMKSSKLISKFLKYVVIIDYLIKSIIKDLPKIKELSSVAIYTLIFLFMLLLSLVYKLW